MYNANLHEYYVQIILQVWRKVLQYFVLPADKEYEGDVEIPPRIDFETVCLGVLYGMRQGIRIDEYVLLPKDDFLLMHLPIGSDLSYFKIRYDRWGVWGYFELIPHTNRKDRISKGDKILAQTYDNAVSLGVPFNEIMIDVSTLPEKREEQIIEGTVPMIITSNGEQLFMPTSRKK